MHGVIRWENEPRGTLCMMPRERESREVRTVTPQWEQYLRARFPKGITGETHICTGCWSK